MFLDETALEANERKATTTWTQQQQAHAPGSVAKAGSRVEVTEDQNLPRRCCLPCLSGL